MTLCTEVGQGSAVHAAAPGPWRPHEAVLVTLVAGGGVAVVVQRAGAPVLAVLLPPVRPVAALGVVLAHRLHQLEGARGHVTSSQPITAHLAVARGLQVLHLQDQVVVPGVTQQTSGHIAHRQHCRGSCSCCCSCCGGGGGCCRCCCIFCRSGSYSSCSGCVCSSGALCGGLTSFKLKSLHRNKLRRRKIEIFS